MPAIIQHESETPGLLRRLAAMAYDGLLLAGLLMLAGAPVVMIGGGPPTSPVARTAYRLYLLAVIFLFFGWFWTHGGQTLGMRAWRLKLTGLDGAPITWGTAGRRAIFAFFSLALLGLGFLWAIHDRERRTWHDRLSHTRVVLLPKRRQARRSL
jgi:uncharacterized RDD family membrane protein YckC